MNKFKLFQKTVLIVVTLFVMTPMLKAAVVIEGPDGTLTYFGDVKCCDDWGYLPPGWDCIDNC